MLPEQEVAKSAQNDVRKLPLLHIYADEELSHVKIHSRLDCSLVDRIVNMCLIQATL